MLLLIFVTKSVLTWDILLVMSNVTGISRNLGNKCPKWLVEQNSGYSDYFNVISGFISNSRAPGGPVTLTPGYSVNMKFLTVALCRCLCRN